MAFVHDFSAVAVSLGPVDIRWYGLLYAVTLTSYYLVARWIFKREGLSQELLESMVIWMFVGLLVGSRLGHVFFYEAGYYLQHPLEILMVWKGGLASHGGAIGLLVSFLLWARRQKVDMAKLFGLIVIPMPLAAGFVRIGNFMNSEIVGHPTEGPFGVIFAKLGEDFARHPVQLYSTVMNWIVFAVLITVYLKFYKKLPKAFLAFLYIGLYFLGRFTVEYWKDLQGPLESLPITMGQLLSVVPVLVSLGYFVSLVLRKKK